MKVTVFDYFGRYCITFNQAEELYNLIYKPISDGEVITLDFNKVIIFSSIFFNYSIGLLFKDFSAKYLAEKLQEINLQEKSIGHLNLIKTNCEKYFSDPNYAKAVNEAIAKYIEEYE